MDDVLKAKVLEAFRQKSTGDKKMFYIRDVVKWLPEEDRHAIQNVVKELIDGRRPEVLVERKHDVYRTRRTFSQAGLSRCARISFMEQRYPRLVFSALRGGAGKTTVSVAVVAALQKRGINIVPFKKGPDYIDAAWLALAASKPCYNLDSFLMSPEQVVRSFSRRRTAGSWAVIEGNRGLYDGVDSAGAYSTAELAKLIKAPVVLIVDSDKVTRTAAAMVRGCQCLDPEVDIRGVILNRVSGGRHSSVIAKALQDSCGLPVLGAIPRMDDFLFLERHLGLVPPQEHDNVAEVISQAVSLAEEELDLDGIIRIAQSAAPWNDDALLIRRTEARLLESRFRSALSGTRHFSSTIRKTSRHWRIAAPELWTSAP